MHAKNPDREIRRKIQEIGEKHYIETFEKNPHRGDLGGTSIFPYSAGLFAALFIKKRAAFRQVVWEMVRPTRSGAGNGTQPI